MAILANITICEALLTQKVNDVADLTKDVKSTIIGDIDSDLTEVAAKTVSFNNSKQID
jgi:hypothetical protein